MHSRINRLALLVSLVIVALPCVGDSPAKKITIFGYRTCETWTKDRAENSSGKLADTFGKSFDETWLVGFMSGVNAATGMYLDNPLGSVDSAIIFDWMDKYCEAHPNRDVSDGGIELFNKLLDLSKKTTANDVKSDAKKGPGG
jgi:hypothetical protein